MNAKGLKTIKALVKNIQEVLETANRFGDFATDAEELRDEEQGKLDNMPESLQTAPAGEKMTEWVDALGALVDALNEADNALDMVEQTLGDIENLI